MPFICRNLSLPAHQSEEALKTLVSALTGLPADDVKNFRILRKGVDARRKPHIKAIYTVSFTVVDEPALRARLGSIPDLDWQPESLPEIFVPVSSRRSIIIAGSGPAGLFTALRLAEYGLTATIVERGQPVEQRALNVAELWENGILDPESNVQFGEGGAGTFSDGKLTCRSKGVLTPWVLERLVDFGAPGEIRYLAKPHIGTDRLRTVVSAIRHYLIDKGFVIRFASRLSDIVVRNGGVTAVCLNDAEELPCDLLVLATGHSARDTYELLERSGVPLERKPFAMGVRIEHPQELIDRIQYGGTRYPGLPPADYAIAWNSAASGRSAYSFCMCPGGVVINGASETGGVVTNGMSGQLRNGAFANSALVVNVTVDDFGGTDPLAGIRFQRQWERQAFAAGGGSYRAPAQDLLSFMGLPGKKPSFSSSYRPGITETDLATALPGFIAETLREGLKEFGRKLRGFVTSEASLIGIESRTSAPVRILRDERYESTGLPGLYPAGEGAGYAGGIMSSAIDGIKIADTIALRLNHSKSSHQTE